MAPVHRPWIRWYESKDLAWQEATYDNVLVYQDEQDSGAWSKSGKPLARGTSNGREDDATHFLKWAAQRGLRGELKVNHTVQHKRIGGGMCTVNS
jgi:hypothetical protein